MKNRTTATQEQSPAHGASAGGRKLVRRGPSPMALEQRFMFDGAALADASQTVAAADAAASHDVAVADSHPADATPTVVVAAAPAPTPAPELMHVVSGAQEAPAALAQAQADAERLIGALLQQPDARAQLFELFNGGQSQPSAEWQRAADSFLASYQDGAAPVRVELRSHAEMHGAMAAFAAQGTDGQPTIYLNGDWARQVATPDALTRALVEEYGHSIDAALNGVIDTAGDEGEAFAQRALGVTPDADQASRIAAEDDHDTLLLDGRTVEVEQAAVSFTVVYQGTPASWSEEAQSLTLSASPFNGSSYRFISSDPSDLYFKGNNVTGYLSYVDQSGSRQQIYGVVSRLFKTGSTIDGFYFYAPGADGLINGVGDSAYLLAITPSKFAGGNNYGTSSDPVDTALNKFIPPNSAPLAGNDSASVLEDGVVNGNLLQNDSDANGDTLRVAQFSVSGQTYAVGLGGSATATLANVGSLTVGSDGSYRFTPAANYAGAVPVVTYTVTDGIANASASLSLAIVGVNDAPDGADKTIATREDSAYVFSAADFGFRDSNDAPANALEAVKIVSLPTQGTLSFNGVAISAAQVANGYFVAVADIGKLSFQPLANQAASASFSFQVRDNGGTANGGVNLDPVANTITFAIANVNDAPLAVADLATAREAGGTANGAAGLDPSGNLLDNDTDPDPSDGKSVVSAGSAGAALAAVGAGTPILGQYGTLTLSSNGAYTYAVNNANAAVQALRLSGHTLTETFSYVMRDTGGLTSSSTLTVTITGANDAPVAVNDIGSAKEAGATSAYPGSAATGNVLANDSDVDAGDALTLTQIFATASGVSTGGGSVTSTTFHVASIANIETNNLVFRADGTTALGRVLSITDDDGAGPGTAGTIVMDAAYTITNGETLQFSQTAGNSANFVSNGLAVTTAIVAGASSTVQLSNIAGTVLVGMSVTGTGNASDPTVTAINRATGVVTLSAPATLSSATALRFVALPGSSIQGQRGTLNIAADGAYTYTITNNSLNAGQTFDETFTYQVRDSGGLTGSAVLTVRIEGTGNVDTEPDAQPDGAAATEAGGVANGSGAVNPVGNVLTNDTGSNLAVSAAWSDAAPSAASVTGGTTSSDGRDIAGFYGSLRLGADGSYVYTLNNSNATVQALNAGASLTDLFFYRAANGAGSDVSSLKIVIAGNNDAPLAADDAASAAEAGGTANATPGYGAAGNVLANDSDVDNAAAGRSVSAVRLGGVEGSGAAGVLGSAFQGSYGVLTLHADGSYSYAVDNANPAVNALAAGATLVERFNYTVSDGSLSDSAVLSIVINGANDAPQNSLPASHSQYDYQQANIAGLSVHDVDGNLAGGGSVTLSVGQGLLSVTAGAASVSGNGSAASPLVLSGSEADINAALATLQYQPAANHSGQDTLKMVSQDSLGLSDTDFVSIAVRPDDRALTVDDVLVNEGSPYAVFRVDGQAGQLVRLSIASGSALAGSDFSGNLEYYNGSAWTAYAGDAVAIPGVSGAATLLVRAAILNDQSYEGAESFTLSARNVAGAGATGTGTIVDDGSGHVYRDTPGGGIDAAAIGDDDRPLAVSSIEVNEASPYAVFSVSGAVGQRVTLALANGNASDSDHGAGLQYLSGGQWLDYTGPVTMSATTLLVRTAITQDGVYEGRETFNLAATGSGGLTARGEAAIYDDGTGNIYLSDNVSGTPDSSGAGFPSALDDDRQLAVQGVRVNEASDYAVFVVSGTAGQFVSLNVVDGSASVAQGQAPQVWNGAAWVDYNGAVLPEIGANGTLLVRVGIVAEQDAEYEFEEDFRLQATLSPANGSLAREGVAIIADDGSGARFGDGVANGLPQLLTSGLDDDRALAVSNVTVSEASPYAVFTVSGTAGQALTLSLQATGSGAGFATLGTDTGTALQYFDGNGWVAYGGSVTMSGSSLLVRVAVTQDSVFEGPESFRLLATNNSGKNSTGGVGTIRDDGGSSTVFNEADTMPQAGAADDDRALAVSNVTVSEASPYAVFTVSGTAGQVLTLSLQATGNGAGFATLGADTGAALQYFDGNGWVAYGGSVTMAGNSLLVRVAVNQDSVYEGAESFRLLANNSSGKTSTGGVGTIRDDGGSSTVFNENDTTPQVGAADDDRALAVSDVTVSEASPYAVFTVSGTAGQVLTLALQATGNGAGFATPGTDTGTALQYFDGNSWVAYNGGVTMSGSSLLVRVAINQDSVYEGAETFRLLAINSSGKTSTGGIGTISDDGGSVTVFNEADTAPQTGPADDDRALAVSDVTVSEASPYAVFTVSGTAGQVLTLSLQATGSGAGFATLGADTGTTLQYFDGNGWVAYSGSVTMGGSSLLVRVAVNQDNVYEGAESFRLLAINNSGKNSTGGVGTIRDDGGSVVTFGETDATPQAGAADDDRALAVSDVTVSEASPYAVFTVSGAAGQVLTLALQATGSGAGHATLGVDTGSTLQYFDGAAWVDYRGSVTMTGNSLLARVAVHQDQVYEGPESLRLLATNSSGKTSTGGIATIRDDGGSDVVFNETDTTPQTGAADDDRALTVSDITVSEASPYAVFTVSGAPGQQLSLALQSGSATVGVDTGAALQYFDGAAWRDYTPGSLVAMPPGAGALLVRVAIVNDSQFEGSESFRLVATGRSGIAGVGSATIKDDGSSREVYLEGNTSGRPTLGAADDDQSRPQVPVQPVAQASAAPAPAPLAPARAYEQPAPFDSTLTLTAARAPEVPRAEPAGDLTTSNAGFQVPVVEGDAPRLSTYRSVSDQFVEGQRSVTITLPYDAFVHTRAEATVVLAATLTNGQSLPAWIRFDARTGSFTLNPPPDFTGEMEVKVIARDNEGREAATVFRLFVGEGKQKLPARSSLSEQIRLAGKRGSAFADLARAQEPAAQRQQGLKPGGKA